MSEIVACPRCGNLIEGDVICNQCGFDGGKTEKQNPVKDPSTWTDDSSVSSSSSKKELLNQTMKSVGNTANNKGNTVLISLTAVVVFILVFAISSSKVPMWPLYLLLAMVAPFGITGYYVGRRTGNALEGFWFGAILGPLGIIIAFVLEDKERESCVMCGEKIRIDAHVCPFCGDAKS
ncbi:hypothetical protein [Pseudaeromonas pectinilytica]